MKARAIVRFDGARDGDTYPARFQPGDLCEGVLAEVAVREKWAEEIEPEGKPEPNIDLPPNASGPKVLRTGRPGR